MSDKVYDRLKKEKDRPRTATFKDCQSHMLPKIEELFKQFWEVSLLFNVLLRFTSSFFKPLLFVSFFLLQNLNC